jgi:hypothetical protein
MSKADSHDNTTNVIKFPHSVSRRAHVETAVVDRPPARSLSAIGKNEHLRKERREVWREADTAREYWKARLEMESAIALAQSYSLPEGDNHPPHNPDERMALLANWRQAIAQQLLTPASDTAAVAWKKLALARGEHEYTDIKTARLERAIADDLAFLAAHPVRQTRRERG